MSEIRLYTDEHISRAVIRGLRQRGVDVLSVPQANMIGASDEQHLALAHAQQRAIFTQDADFLRLAARGIPHSGIIFAPQHTSLGEIIQGLMLVYQILEAKI